MMDRTGKNIVLQDLGRRLFVGFVAAGALALCSALSAGAAETASSGPASSCVVCHTDVERLKAEAAKVPVPAASALQAGKG